MCVCLCACVRACLPKAMGGHALRTCESRGACVLARVAVWSQVKQLV